MSRFEAEFPLRVVSGDNAHVHWRRKAANAARARNVTGILFRSKAAVAGWKVAPVPLQVWLTRIAPRPLDTDGLASALKPVRDQVAAELGLRSDTGPRVVWTYCQMRGSPKQHAVRVVVAERAPNCSNCLAWLTITEPGAWDLEHCPNADCIYRAPKQRRVRRTGSPVT